jgi:hypothetical protein
MSIINELCQLVRETAYAIHVYHGHGHLEKVYENALAHRLRKLGLNVKQQYPITVFRRRWNDHRRIFRGFDCRRDLDCRTQGLSSAGQRAHRSDTRLSQISAKRARPSDELWQLQISDSQVRDELSTTGYLKSFSRFFFCVLCVLSRLFFLVALVRRPSKQRPQQSRAIFQQPFRARIKSIGSLAFHVDRANHLALIVQNWNDDPPNILEIKSHAKTCPQRFAELCPFRYKECAA